MKGKGFSGIVFALSILGGIGISAARFAPFLFLILALETAFVVQMPCCRNFETVWEFVLFCGTMVPVHLFWLYPVAFDIYGSEIRNDAYGMAYVFLITFCVFSAELLAVLLFVRRIVKRKRRKDKEYRRKK